MNKSDLLYRLEETRNLYRLARERKDDEQMRGLEKIARDLKLRIKKNICMWCKDNEKVLDKWPFCSDDCSKEYEESKPKVSVTPINTETMNREFQKRMERVEEVKQYIREHPTV